MAKSLNTLLKEAEKRIVETKDNLQSLATKCDHCFRVEDKSIGKLSKESYHNLKTISSYLKILSRSKDYNEVAEQLIQDFKHLLNDYYFLKRQYSF